MANARTMPAVRLGMPPSRNIERGIARGALSAACMTSHENRECGAQHLGLRASVGTRIIAFCGHKEADYICHGYGGLLTHLPVEDPATPIHVGPVKTDRAAPSKARHAGPGESAPADTLCTQGAKRVSVSDQDAAEERRPAA